MTQARGLHDAGSFDDFVPRLRAEVLARFYGDEAVVGTSTGHAPIYLSPVPTLVFQLIDGTSAISDFLADIHDVVGVPKSVARDQLRHVLHDLEIAGLLTTWPEHKPEVRSSDVFPAPPNP